MINQPIAQALNLRWQEPEEKPPRLRRARRIALTVRRVAAEWHRAAENEWLVRIERPFSQTL